MKKTILIISTFIVINASAEFDMNKCHNKLNEVDKQHGALIDTYKTMKKTTDKKNTANKSAYEATQEYLITALNSAKKACQQ